MRGIEGGAGNGMAERLGLGLCGGRGSEGGLGFGRRRGVGEEVDLLRDGAAEVVEGLADVGWVVVCFVGVLRARRSDGGHLRGRRRGVRDLQHSRVHLFQRIDSLLELNIVGRELSLCGQVLTAPALVAPVIWTRRCAGETAHLVLDIADRLLDILRRPGSPGGEGSAVAAMSA